MHITRREALLGGSAMAASSLLPSLAHAQASQASLAYGPATTVYALGSIAQEKGFLKGEGLDLKLVVGNAGTHGRQSLAAGQALFAHGDCSHPLQLSTRGKKCRLLLASQMVASISNVIVRKDLFDAGIDSIEKLAAYKRPNGGKPVIAATAIGSGTWMYGTYLFESKGLGNQVTWVAGGGINTMLPGLETKQFDAVMAIPGWVLDAENGGFGRAIFNTSQPGVFTGAFGGTVPVLVFYTLEETIQQERAKVQAFVNAIYQAMKWVKSAPTDEIFGLIGEKYFGGQNPDAVKAELIFDKNTWAYDGRIDKPSFERGGKIWYRQGTDIPETKFEDIVDMSFLDAAQATYK